MENIPKTSSGVNKSLIAIIAVVLVAGAAVGVIFAVKNNSKQESTMEELMEKDKAMLEDSGKTVDDAMMAHGGEEQSGSLMDAEQKIMDSEAQNNGNNTQEVKGSYIEYSPEALAKATQEGKAVLFFHAKWCPFCKAADTAFNARLDDIPDGVTILKTDYDTYTDLKIRYGITYQHAFVQVDAQGNQITKWNGGDLDSLKANLR